MRLLLICTILLRLLSIGAVNDKYQTFKETVNSGYLEYVNVYEASNDYYTLSVYEGLSGTALYYSIFLASEEASTFSLIITIDGHDFTVKEDSRGDYMAYFLPNQSDIEVKVSDFTTIRKSVKLEYYTVEQFKSQYESSLITGQNQSITITPLKRIIELTPVAIVSIVFGGIIFFSSIILLILFVTKKGLFDKERPQQDILNYRNLSPQPRQESPKQSAYVVEERIIYPHFKDEDEEVDLEKVHKYLEEENISHMYSAMSEEEKTKVMIALMNLRANNKITEKEYKEEAIRLWSK